MLTTIVLLMFQFFQVFTNLTRDTASSTILLKIKATPDENIFLVIRQKK